MKTFDGYKKRALTDKYALLAGGGHKPLSDFSTSAHTHSIKINGTTKTIAASGGAAVDLGNYKTILTAVTSPTASGTSISFIDTISLNTNGVIAVTKKTVQTMGGATASAAGTTGMVPAPTANLHTLFLKGDGTWATPSDTHWTTHLYVGAKDAASNAATTNGNTYIKVTDNSTIRNQYIIKGAGRTTIASDSSGNITITSPTVTWSEISGKPSTFTPNAHNHPTSQINALTSYTKATAAAALATTDSLNTALGKLEYKLDVAYDLVTKANDSDGTIENLKEILDVLAGIKDTETIKAIIGKYLPLAGGTMTGQILKAGVSSSWISGRSNAFLRTTTISGYSPFASIKTTNGSWEIGVYNLSSYYDDLIFSYCTDENYNNGNNSTTSQIRFFEDGTIGASITGNAATANKWTTARILTIGNTSKSIDGSANVSWSLAEIGAASSGHTHTFASLTSKPTTITGYGITDTFKIIDDGSAYLNLSMPSVALSKKAVSTYIECWDPGDGAGWWNWKAGKWITAGGTSSHFVKGDGSLDSNAYSTTTHTHDNKYLKLTGGILRNDSMHSVATLNATNGSNDAWNKDGNAILKFVSNNNAMVFSIGSPGNERTGFIQVGHADTVHYAGVTSSLHLNKLGGTVYINNNVAWHAGNDGSGSGLDADLLDGKHASAFASASHTHAYLPLSGGSVRKDSSLVLGPTAIPYGQTGANDWVQMLHTMPFETGKKSDTWAIAIGCSSEGRGVILNKAFGINSSGILYLLPDGKVLINKYSCDPKYTLDVGGSIGGQGFYKSGSNNNYALTGAGGHIAIHTGRNNEANKLVRTDASGYIQAGWINTTSGDMGTTAITRIYCSNDGFIRYKTPANFFSTLANDTNLLSITIGSLNRKLTIDYSISASRLNNTSVSDPAKAVNDSNKQALQWFSQISLNNYYAGNNYGFPASNNANGILYLGTHALSTSNAYYGGQLGVSSNGRLYYRFSNGSAWSTAANGGSWKTLAWTSDIPTVTDYYWANVKVSASSSTSTQPTFNTCYTSNWFRSTGSTGWYNESYGGGIYMSDTTYVRTYNDKAFYVSNSGQHAIYTAGGFATAKTSGALFSSYYNSTWYTDTIYSYGNGNISINAPGGSLFLSLERGNTYFGGSTYYINRSGYFNGSCSYAGNADKLDGYHFSDLESRYVNVSGDSMSGILNIQTQALTKSSPTLQQLVINGPSYNASNTLTLQSYPGIGFHMPSLTWASLIFNGNFTGVNGDFSGYVPFYGSGFIKHGSSNSYVLLGGGGHKAESSLSVNYASTSGTSNYSYYLRGRSTDGTYFGSEAGDNIIAEWNTKSDSRWYLKAASSYECRVAYATSAGYASSAGNAESVDGQHFNWSNNRDDHTYLWAASSNGQAYLVHRASMSVNYANYSGYTQKLQVHDVRSAIRTPNYFDGKRVTAWFNNTGTPDGNWWSGIHVKGWDNGYASWELCSYSSTGTGNDYNLYFRNGNNTSWGSWKTILTSSNYTSYINTTNFPGLNKAGTVTSITVTGSNGLSGSGTVTTSGTITLSNSGVRSTTINGNYLRVNTNGTNTDLTIPYATNADTVDGYHASSFALRGHTHSNYLPLAGGTMDNNARISHNGNLYIGRSDNGGWVLCLDMCSLSSTGDTYWSLRTSGTLKVKFVYLDIIYPKTSAVKILGLMAVGDNSFSAKTGYWLSSQSIYVGNENKTEFFDLSGDGIHVIHPLPHIDFYKGKSSVDGNYTLRLIENTEGRLTLDSATTTPSLLLAGNIYASGYYESSDITLKTNFSKISTTIEQISNLPVFDFSWKENLSSRNTGTSAQAVQTILPNIVTESSSSLKLNYGVLGTVASIIACKELVIQKSEIEQLRERVIELEKQLNEYRGSRNSLGN